jgi:hypothetical protein
VICVWSLASTLPEGYIGSNYKAVSSFYVKDYVRMGLMWYSVVMKLADEKNVEKTRVFSTYLRLEIEMFVRIHRILLD